MQRIDLLSATREKCSSILTSRTINDVWLPNLNQYTTCISVYSSSFQPIFYRRCYIFSDIHLERDVIACKSLMFYWPLSSFVYWVANRTYKYITLTLMYLISLQFIVLAHGQLSILSNWHTQLSSLFRR